MALWASLPSLWAQSNVLTVVPPAKITAKHGDAVTAKVQVQVQSGYHVNSNTPTDAYLIPLRLTWESTVWQPGEVTFPKPVLEKYEFAEKALSVFTGNFEIVTKFKVPAEAPSGLNIVAGKLRYQACTNQMCLPPKTLEVKFSVDTR